MPGRGSPGGVSLSDPPVCPGSLFSFKTGVRAEMHEAEMKMTQLGSCYGVKAEETFPVEISPTPRPLELGPPDHGVLSHPRC